MLLLVGSLVCLAGVSTNMAQDISIWVLGRHTTAEVVDAWIKQINDDAREPTFQYFVRYRFTTSRGQVFTGTSRVGVQEWAGLGMGGPVAAVYQEQENVPQYSAGGLAERGTVTVVYFPLYPAHNRLDESRFIPILACAYMPLIFLGWIGLAAGRHLVRPSARIFSKSGGDLPGRAVVEQTALENQPSIGSSRPVRCPNSKHRQYPGEGRD